MDRPLMRLTRLRIGRFRYAAPTELHFGPGHNVLIGRNGTGKTNLLKLIAAVVRGRLDPLEREEFDIGWTFEVGPRLVDVEVKQVAKVAETRLAALASEAAPALSWSYRIAVRAGERLLWEVNATEADVEFNPLGTVDGIPWLIDRISPFDDDFVLSTLVEITGTEAGGDHDVPRELWRAVADMRACGRLDEGLDAFRWLTGSPSPEFGPGPGAPTVRWERQGLFAPHARGLAAPVIREAIAVRLNADESPAALRLHAGDLSLARRFTELAPFDDLYVTPVPAEYREGSSARFESFRFEAKLRSGLVVAQDRLSYGQRRLLAFLYQLDACPDVLIADELVNGFHHTWLEKAMELLEGRQTFLTSQNPLLLDHLWFESVEDVKHTFVLCRGASSPDEPAWSWRHPSEDEASSLKAAYDVGIQHVGELLQVHGLW